MIETAPASGSCARCGRALDLAAAKVEGRWYGNRACASGGECLLLERETLVPEPWLYARPRRHFGPRAPIELQKKWPEAARTAKAREAGPRGEA